MKIKLRDYPFCFQKRILFIIMKTFIILFCTTVLGLTSEYSFSQERISIQEDQLVTVNQVFRIIKKQTNYGFIYPKKLFKNTPKIQLKKGEIELRELLKLSLGSSNLKFKVSEEKTITFLEMDTTETAVDVQQTIDVKGVVTDDLGQPLPGANIIERGTANGTQTDFDGMFALSVSNSNAVLVVSYLGFKSVEIGLSGETELRIQLQEDAANLEEIVVIGYGTARKTDLTGSVASVDSEQFHNIPVTNAEGLIANQLPGIQITPQSGRPGAGSNILIRGGSSLNASNDPLIVIDGVPLEGGNNGPGILSQLNPNDIENFTVLKDASSAAIYGSRASNGVIIITTKKGQLDEFQISLNSNTRISQVRELIPVLNGDEYRAVVEDLGSSSTPVGNANTNWQEEIYQIALATENNLSASGAIRNIPFRASMGFLKQDGIVKTDEYERITALLNLNPKFFDNHLKINLNLKGSLEDQRLASDGIFYYAQAFDPTQPVYVEDQTYGGYFQYTQFATNPALAIPNPLSVLEQLDRRNESKRFIGNVQLDYKFHFFPDLHLNINAGVDLAEGKWREIVPDNYFPASVSEGSIYVADPSNKIENKLLEAYLSYTKNVDAINSNFDITLGYSYNDFLRTNYNYSTTNYNGDIFPNSIPAFPFDKPSNALISFYGRLNYSFNNKYLLTASLRHDGSSRFSEEKRWGTFPAVALAWKINQENFLKDSKVLSSLKLRMSFGITGQQDGIGNYEYIPGYSQGELSFQYLFGDTRYSTVTPGSFNPNLKWEQTESSNIGVDFGFFNNRLSGSIDGYYKVTKDLLNLTVIPLGVNFDNELLLNIGSMENKGVEFTLNTIPIKNDNLTWRFNTNFTYNDGKITKLTDSNDDSVGLFSDVTLVNTVGYKRNTFYLYRQVYNENGRPIEGQMVDLMNDGMLNAEDRYITDKSTTPDYLIGLNTTLNYKNWNFGAAAHANIGHYIFYKPLDDAIAITTWQVSQNLHRSYYETGFRTQNVAQSFSDYYLQNASFLKLDNINVGYTFNSLKERMGIGLNINASVQNVFTITKYTGRDPEALGGYENTYPIPRIYALGINVNF
ncbi:SusC/RagA family TonB-linked outer membrane protein [Aestuariivivens sediminis]|uniref:SusC/RagA family TonB-linked outer membrane protein n=1 Tax=Aestuariivivens sediminis TaxID=2913557 RepID=UPI001F5688B0|nr:TonB-dependent receptor [Aestuariivivens sediminis]